MKKNRNNEKLRLRSRIRPEFFLTLALTLTLAYSSYAGDLEPLRDVPIPDNNPQTQEKIELGKKLFFDRRLSGDGTMSCVTCHNPELAFADGLDISLSYPTTKNWRNSPALVNVAYRKYLFHDGRAKTLEDQALQRQAGGLLGQVEEFPGPGVVII